MPLPLLIPRPGIPPPQNAEFQDLTPKEIDDVAADLRAHHEDTEAHPKFYRVGEQ
jgi:hypothetical protein